MKLGITGSLGSGKTTVSGIFRELGAVVVDADQLSRQAVEPGQPAYFEIVKEFGIDFVGADGMLDRPALSRMIFRDSEARRILERIIHPHVRREMRRAGQETSSQDVVVFDVPLLFETGMNTECDRTCVVYVTEEVRMQRMNALGMGAEEVLGRLQAQMPQEEKIRRADFTINNSGSLNETRQQAVLILDILKKLAAPSCPPKE